VSFVDRISLYLMTKIFPEDAWWLAWDVGKTAAEISNPEKALAVSMQFPRDRWETAWDLWKEMNLKGSKRRFSKREGIDKALMMDAIRKLKKKNEEISEENARLIEENKRLVAGLLAEHLQASLQRPF